MNIALILLTLIVWLGIVLMAVDCLSVIASDQTPPNDFPNLPPADADEDADALPFGPTPGQFASPVKSPRTDQA